MLAPLTNQQSHDDGTLSEDEFNWLVKRAEGGFGLVITCATYVQDNGKGFPGQLGIAHDIHIDGHMRLASAIKSHGALALVQLYHGGLRCPTEVIGEQPVSPSSIEKYGSRGMSTDEVSELRDNFISAARRAQECGYDGVEVHGAHGYIISQFLSTRMNQRTDDYGGSLENRSRLLYEIVKGIREACGKEFLLSLRLSPERFGMRLSEIKTICEQLIGNDLVDLLDISLWDVFKLPEESEHKHQGLMDHFTELDNKGVKLTVAGKIRSAADVKKVLESGVDIVTIGRAAILHHDFPKQVENDASFTPVSLPVSRNHLKEEGVGEEFIKYLGNWPGFVAD